MIVMRFMNSSEPLLNILQKKVLTINHAYILSDGCSFQYKSSLPFADASCGDIASEYRYRNFYGSRHGISRCDGERGVLKARARRSFKNEESVINTAHDFYAVCKKLWRRQQLKMEFVSI